METRVLIVDDTPEDRLMAGAIVESHLGWKVEYAEHGRAALALLQQRGIDVVITDLQMPQMDRLQLVDNVRTKFASIPVILLTALGSEEITIRALHRGAARYGPQKNID